MNSVKSAAQSLIERPVPTYAANGWNRNTNRNLRCYSASNIIRTSPQLTNKEEKIRIAFSLLKPDAHYEVSRLEVEPIFPDSMFYFCSAVT